MQFLGAKTRVLESLGSAAQECLDPESRILDVFSGSSLVGQELGRGGFSVAATDALEHCVHFARALLGVERPAESRVFALDALNEEQSWIEPWRPWLRREAAALEDRDSDALIRLAEATPQVWRQTNASRRLIRELDRIRPGATTPGLVTAHYAGTYFGINQAIAIDTIRGAIAKARKRNQIGDWEESALLTALLSAASDCAFSAGKHYAQPHRIRPGKDLSFIRSRVLTDRSKDVLELFRERLLAVGQAAHSAGSGHAATRATLEELCASPGRAGELDAIYADPPYTSQQYSRFYHVPEVICSHRVPALQRRGGQVTRGLYFEGRFKSRFCSRRHVKEAFQDLIGLARAHEAVLLLSYSGSQSGMTGNERSISLPDLRALLHSAFGRRNVEERELGITYRQFNSTRASVAGRDDVEKLFIAVADA